MILTISVTVRTAEPQLKMYENFEEHGGTERDERTGYSVTDSLKRQVII